MLYLLMKTRRPEPGAGRGLQLPSSDQEQGPSRLTQGLAVLGPPAGLRAAAARADGRTPETCPAPADTSPGRTGGAGV